MNGWQSLYLYYGAAVDPDTLILDVAKVIKDQATHPDDWFFVRYWEDGAHLRVRLANGAGEAAPELLNSFAGLTSGAGNLAADLAGSILSVKEVPYVPETIRYGGPDALSINEQLFRISTAIALKCVSAIVASPNRRVGLGLDLMLSALAAAGRYCTAFAFFEGYHAAWVDMLKTGAALINVGAASGVSLEARIADRREVVSGLRAAKTPSEFWCRELQRACVGFEAVMRRGMLISPRDGGLLKEENGASNAIVSMLYSQMHMMNNRIGLSVPEEMALSDWLARELEAG